MSFTTMILGLFLLTLPSLLSAYACGIFNDMAKTGTENPVIDGPVQTERQKLEKMAQSLGINAENKSDLELKQTIDSRFGTSETDAKNLKDSKFKN